MQRCVLPFTLAVLLVAPVALAGNVLTLVERDAGGERVRRIVLEVEGGQLRLDPEARGEDERHSLLFDAADETLTILDHSERRWVALDREQLADLAGGASAALAEARRQMEAQLAGMPPQQREMVRRMMEQRLGAVAAPADKPPAPSLRETDRREERAGHAARLVEVVSEGRVVRRHWVAPWSAVGVGDVEAATLEAMMALAADMARSLPAAPSGASFAAASLPGMPVETIELEDGRPTSTTSLAAAESRAIPAEHFTIPAGYSERELPSLTARPQR